MRVPALSIASSSVFFCSCIPFKIFTISLFDGSILTAFFSVDIALSSIPLFHCACPSAIFLTALFCSSCTFVSSLTICLLTGNSLLPIFKTATASLNLPEFLRALAFFNNFVNCFIFSSAFLFAFDSRIKTFLYLEYLSLILATLDSIFSASFRLSFFINLTAFSNLSSSSFFFCNIVFSVSVMTLSLLASF